jgi:23S rRNA (cytidine1920-2'-O)/16S rRNA (cytidine1409-2'-O)-methyltransferase
VVADVARQRADTLLVERGIFPSRERARAAILAGDVRVAGVRIAKAGELVDSDADLEVAEKRRYVSRGGDKLAGALDTFGIDPSGWRAVDVGASTGGFTDCLLQRGASSVCAVDVGYGQLAWLLRQDERVAVFERTNIRTADPDSLGAPFDLVVVDVSFISLTTVLPHLRALMSDTGQLVALVKPQFEAGKGRVGKRGVVRDPDVHADVLKSVLGALVRSGLAVRGMTWSPIKGPEGNIEFWAWAATRGETSPVDPDAIVAAAHEQLGG